MGKIKHTFIKRGARRIYEQNPDEFSTDFNKNKEAIKSKDVVKSKSIRNKMAGYAIKIIKNKKF
ncbi:MAG: 30S ribosomal protein S17e [Candidatus Aenigmarchaeota archaeon]|nr:30S ribosomal protein S17e [Candidatus Aenigmarchaeota archaeon]MCK5289380.1 30S ribosomal protein S17e [Candidatus Aenigmarchaeota archaeon]MCK5451806.1 30S ribosomal protein S17e [Candidatus Aenigmarchaeota archaeon]